MNCNQCGMATAINEYHPYAACLMYRACQNASVVRENLKAVRGAAEAQSASSDELRQMVAKLAAHVRPTCGELWAEAERLLNRTEAPSVPVGVEGLVERMRQAPSRLWMADLVGQKISVERMRDILAFALAQQPAPRAPVEASYHPCTSVLIEGLKRLEGGSDVLAEWDRARAKADTALAQQPAAVDGETVEIDGRLYSKEVVKTALLGLAADLTAHPTADEPVDDEAEAWALFEKEAALAAQQGGES